MDELTDKISQILSDPDGMDMVKNLAQSLMGEQDGRDTKQENSTSSGIFDDIPLDPGQLGIILKAMNRLKSGGVDDERVRLLMALRPNLSEERQKKTDNAIKMLKMIKLMPLIKDAGIFDMF